MLRHYKLVKVGHKKFLKVRKEQTKHFYFCLLSTWYCKHEFLISRTVIFWDSSMSRSGKQEEMENLLETFKTFWI